MASLNTMLVVELVDEIKAAKGTGDQRRLRRVAAEVCRRERKGLLPIGTTPESIARAAE